VRFGLFPGAPNLRPPGQLVHLSALGRMGVSDGGDQQVLGHKVTDLSALYALKISVKCRGIGQSTGGFQHCGNESILDFIM